MSLSGPEILKNVRNGKIKISPFDEKKINPNSYNYTLCNHIKRITNKVIDFKKADETEDIYITSKGYTLLPGECYLGSTNEIIGSDYFVGLVTGRSSVGRKFVTNHVTAGLIDQGFHGIVTLEITVVKPTIIYPNISFGQVYWFRPEGETLLYNGQYLGQLEPKISGVHNERF